MVCGGAWLAACCTAFAVPIYSNGNPSSPNVVALNAQVTASNGAAAPSGKFFSEVQASSPGEANAIAGFACNNSGTVPSAGAFRFADDFVVPAGHTWRVNSLSVFAYQGGYAASASPFDAVFLRIWQGRPGVVGSSVVYGDLTTNRMAWSVATDIYRVFNTTVTPLSVPGTTRRIWQLNVNAGGVTLSPGTYWIEWQVRCTDPNAEAFSPVVTVSGARTTAGANAMQFRDFTPGGAWYPLIDTGKPSPALDLPIDLPFQLDGLDLTGPGCLADVASDSLDTAFNPNGSVGAEDLDAFIGGFVAGNVAIADVASDSLDATRAPNGAVGSEDLDAFIAAFIAGC